MSAKLNFCPTCGKTLAWADDVGGFCATCGYVGGYAQGAGERAPAAQGAPNAPAPQPAAAQEEGPSAASPRTPFEPVLTSADACPRFFNWGALLLPFVWSLGNRLWLWGGVMGGMWLVWVILYAASIASMMRQALSSSNPMSSPMFALSLVSTMYGMLLIVVNLGISIYLGVDGNRLAWRARGFTSAKAFRDEQRVWTIVGLVIVGLMFLLFIINVVMGIVFFSQMLHSFPGVPK